MTDPALARLAAANADPLVGTHPPERLRLIHRLRAAAVACTLALIVLGLAWELWLAPLPGGTGALALKVLPLTPALGGLLRHRLYTYRWLSLLVWLYVAEGLVRGSGDQGLSQALGLVETALSIALFAVCGWYVRLRLKVLPGRQPGADPDPGAHTSASGPRDTA